MADLLNYTPGGNRLTKRDPRCKLLIIIILPFFVFRFSILISLSLSIFFLLLNHFSGFKIKSLIKSSRGFLFILLLLPGAVMLREGFSGKSVSAFDFLKPGASLSSSLELSLRLLTLYLLVILFIRATGTLQFSNAASWFLSFIPGFPARKTGLLLNLTFNMIPGLMDQWDKIHAAQLTRGIGSVRNPVKRVFAPLFPLLLNSIIRSEITAQALEVRGFKEKDLATPAQIRSLQGLSWKLSDTFLLLTSFSLLFLLAYISI